MSEVKPEYLSKPVWWDEACRALATSDPVMKSVMERNPPGWLEGRGFPYETLLRSVVGQQISTKAAAHIWERFLLACPELEPEKILRKHRKTLRASGLSERKIDYVLDISRFFSEETAFLETVENKSDEEIIEKLCTIKGVGRWTAEMFLIFALRRPDVAPILDYGFLKAVAQAYYPQEDFSLWRVSDKKAELENLIQKWSPWKTAATWHLWKSLNNGPMVY